jgi:enamine deaminase RidA (YjgF/YER057c/UK114 family)
MQRQNISSGSPWEATVGYSRAVRIGNIIEVSGTVAAGDDGVVGRGDGYAQTKFILQKIEKALIEAGVTLENVTRTRIYVTDITQWQAVGKAHGEVFSSIRPATTVVEVSKLVSDDYLVEIEASAVAA